MGSRYFSKWRGLASWKKFVSDAAECERTLIIGSSSKAKEICRTSSAKFSCRAPFLKKRLSRRDHKIKRHLETYLKIGRHLTKTLQEFVPHPWVRILCHWRKYTVERQQQYIHNHRSALTQGLHANQLVARRDSLQLHWRYRQWQQIDSANLLVEEAPGLVAIAWARQCRPLF